MSCVRASRSDEYDDQIIILIITLSGFPIFFLNFIKWDIEQALKKIKLILIQVELGFGSIN